MTKPDDILSLFREMSVQETPEAAATAALAWALRHAPVDGGALEISGHRIERIAPEPDPWPTADLLAWRGMLWAPIAGSEPETPRYYAIHEGDEVWESMDSPFRSEAVPVTVVPVAELDALRESIKALGYGPDGTTGMPGSLLDTALRLIAATDALGVSND